MSLQPSAITSYALSIWHRTPARRIVGLERWLGALGSARHRATAFLRLNAPEADEPPADLMKQPDPEQIGDEPVAKPGEFRANGAPPRLAPSAEPRGDTSPDTEQAASDPRLRRPLIEILDLHMTFHVNSRDVVVFKGFSYKIPEGSFLSVIGPSGCGKSTLLRLIAGLERPTSGEIVFNGREIDGPPKGMIYVFQQYAKSIFPWRTVIQNIEFGLNSCKKIGRREARAKCLEYVKLVGLEGYEDYFPSQLSGGMQQRVALARALIGEPKVLLMDEPFSALDAMTRAILQELLLKIWHTIPITIIFVTHDVEEAVFLSSKIISLGRPPNSLREEVTVDLAYPRDQIKTRRDAQFSAIQQRLFASIFLQEKSQTLG